MEMTSQPPSTYQVLLHSGSSVTIDDHPYIKIDIPSPTPVEQNHANPPLSGVHTTPAVTMLTDSLETQDLPEGLRWVIY